MEKRLTIELSSNLDFEGMVVNICSNMMTIASINYDKGIDKMEIEFFPFGNPNEKTILPLEDFVDVLKKAKQLGIKCAIEEKNRDKNDEL